MDRGNPRTWCEYNVGIILHNFKSVSYHSLLYNLFLFLCLKVYNLLITTKNFVFSAMTMWPMLLDMSRDECKRILRRLGK